jgi:hypothetical protein
MTSGHWRRSRNGAGHQGVRRRYRFRLDPLVCADARETRPRDDERSYRWTVLVFDEGGAGSAAPFPHKVSTDPAGDWRPGFRSSRSAASRNHGAPHPRQHVSQASVEAIAVRVPLLILGVACLVVLGCGGSVGAGSSCAAAVRLEPDSVLRPCDEGAAWERPRTGGRARLYGR